MRGASAELKGLAEESLAFLRAALYDARFPALFELELYGAIVGIFELNNTGRLAGPTELLMLGRHCCKYCMEVLVRCLLCTLFWQA